MVSAMITPFIDDYFSVDEVINFPGHVMLVEHKMVDEVCEKWFYHYSILQTAFYLALAKTCDSLITAKFARKRYGVNRIDLKGRELKASLHFGKSVIVAVDIVGDPKNIIDHFKSKAAVVTKLDYSSAMKWDDAHKFRDFDQLSEFIKYDAKWKDVKKELSAIKIPASPQEWFSFA